MDKCINKFKPLTIVKARNVSWIVNEVLKNGKYRCIRTSFSGNVIVKEDFKNSQLTYVGQV